MQLWCQSFVQYIYGYGKQRTDFPMEISVLEEADSNKLAVFRKSLISLQVKTYDARWFVAKVKHKEKYSTQTGNGSTKPI